MSLLVNAAIAQTKELKVGDLAPDFTASDHTGKKTQLSEMLASRQVLLFFYHGYWSPFCNKQMNAIQDSLQLIAQKNTVVIAITPERDPFVEKTVAKTNARFSIITDTQHKIMDLYGVTTPVDNTTKTRLRTIGVDLNEVNSSGNENVLPVPGVYIIGKDRKLKYIYFEPNYRIRPSVAELLKAM